jgi:hypothetical protein
MTNVPTDKIALHYVYRMVCHAAACDICVRADIPQGSARNEEHNYE